MWPRKKNIQYIFCLKLLYISSRFRVQFSDNKLYVKQKSSLIALIINVEFCAPFYCCLHCFFVVAKMASLSSILWGKKSSFTSTTLLLYLKYKTIEHSSADLPYEWYETRSVFRPMIKCRTIASLTQRNSFRWCARETKTREGWPLLTCWLFKGAQAWDIRSLGFSWFLYHKVSTCGRLRG